MEKLEGWQRTHTCGELDVENIDNSVTLMGWVHRWRDHGGLFFIDVRDRYGLTQIVFDPESDPELYKRGKELRGESVIAVRGKVQKRPDANPNLATGEIEVMVDQLKILNSAKTPPFGIDEKQTVSDEVRLKYRYLDLRGSQMQRNMHIRHKTYQAVRSFFNRHDFIEIETPILMRSTPEGARDFLVPSRNHRGKFYALPQSPQTYKQILMVSGFDRYYQIVRCFRDEDFRADRQPEFTQIDVEMSFVERENVLQMVEDLMQEIFKEVLDIKLPTPFPRLSHEEALTTYGSDKPDTRFGMKIVDVTEQVRDCEFKVFSGNVKSGGIVCGLRLKNGADYSRKQIDLLTELAKNEGAKGLVAIKVTDAGWDSNLAKFFTDTQIEEINRAFNAAAGDLLFLVSDKKVTALTVCGALRSKLAKDENLIPPDSFELTWILDFPLLEYDADEARYFALHHPFTSPMDEDLDKMATKPETVRAKAYDLVLNGYEIAGGSIRIHERDLQNKMFELLSIGEEEAKDKFGFLLEAFEYGAPPHGGIAFGFDRLVMLLAGEKSIRDVIAFPKTTSALSLMDGAPASVDSKQLNELGLKLL